MPTGYTVAIKDGISFEQFVMRSSRAMGALVVMRDESMDAQIPERFQPSDYHLKEFEKAKGELAHLMALPDDDAEREAEAEYHRLADTHRSRAQERHDMKARYETMLAQVSAWEPPTPEHNGLKDFMLQQITESIKFDCSSDYDDPPTRVPGALWLHQRIERTRDRISRHAAEYEKEVERTEGRNRWLKALRDSLNGCKI